MAKYKCNCGKVAEWWYMPVFSGGNSHICNDCISSPDDIGCSCNWHHTTGESAEQPEGVEGKDWRWVEHAGDDYMSPVIKADGIWVNLDEKGRPYPCVEYSYTEGGDDMPTIFDKISWQWGVFKRWWLRQFTI